MIIFPTFMAALPRAGAHHAESATPTPIVTRGVTRISILVSLETAFPISEAEDGYKQIQPEDRLHRLSALDAKPTVIRENNTSGGQCSA